jgi:hypothetical protein
VTNRIIIFILFIVPWLTLFFMSKAYRSRFIASGLYTAVTSGVIYEIGLILGFWYFKEPTFPLVVYGTLPVTSMWVLRVTFEKFWVYTLTNAVLDVVFAFVLFPWWNRAGIIGTYPWTGWVVYGINFFHAASIYAFQLWRSRNQNAVAD